VCAARGAQPRPSGFDSVERKADDPAEHPEPVLLAPTEAERSVSAHGEYAVGLLAADQRDRDGRSTPGPDRVRSP
jgi:hypothetical protein